MEWEGMDLIVVA